MTDHTPGTTAHTDHHGPEGLLTRGTVVVVPGRGETPATYTRFGRRLAADAYRVRVVTAPEPDHGDPAGSLTLFGERLAAAVESTAIEGPPAAPSSWSAPTRAPPPSPRSSGGPDPPGSGRTASSSPGSPAGRLPPEQAAGKANSTSAPLAPPTATRSPGIPAYAGVRWASRCRIPCSPPPTRPNSPFPRSSWSVTPTRSPITTPSRAPPSPSTAPGSRWSAAPTTTCSTTYSTAPWQPRPSPSWRRCATGWCPSWRWNPAPGDHAEVPVRPHPRPP